MSCAIIQRSIIRSSVALRGYLHRTVESIFQHISIGNYTLLRDAIRLPLVLWISARLLLVHPWKAIIIRSSIITSLLPLNLDLSRMPTCEYIANATITLFIVAQKPIIVAGSVLRSHFERFAILPHRRERISAALSNL